MTYVLAYPSLFQCFFMQLFCMCWNQDGSRLATFSKDQVLALYDPRSPGPPVCQGKLDIGGRGARLVWLEDKVIALSGFNRFANSSFIFEYCKPKLHNEYRVFSHHI